MTSVSHNEFFDLLSHGGNAIGFFWRGGASIHELGPDIETDLMYVGWDRATSKLAQRIKESDIGDAGAAHFIEHMKQELDALCNAINTNTLTDHERTKWIINVWTLEKLGAIQNDNMNGVMLICSKPSSS